MAKKVKKENITDFLKSVMKKTGTKNSQIANFRGVTDSSNYVTIHAGTLKTDNLIDILASMGENTVLLLSDGSKHQLIKKENKKV